MPVLPYIPPSVNSPSTETPPTHAGGSGSFIACHIGTGRLAQLRMYFSLEIDSHAVPS